MRPNDSIRLELVQGTMGLWGHIGTFRIPGLRVVWVSSLGASYIIYVIRCQLGSSNGLGTLEEFRNPTLPHPWFLLGFLGYDLGFNFGDDTTTLDKLEYFCVRVYKLGSWGS